MGQSAGQRWGRVLDRDGAECWTAVGQSAGQRWGRVLDRGGAECWTEVGQSAGQRWGRVLDRGGAECWTEMGQSAGQRWGRVLDSGGAECWTERWGRVLDRGGAGLDTDGAECWTQMGQSAGHRWGRVLDTDGAECWTQMGQSAGQRWGRVLDRGGVECWTEVGRVLDSGGAECWTAVGQSAGQRWGKVLDRGGAECWTKVCSSLERSRQFAMPLQSPIPLRGIGATPLAKDKPQYWTQMTMYMAPAHQEDCRFLVPEFLSDFQDVFDEPKSSSLPPHRDCDCAIDLSPGCKFPKGRLFNLSVPEHAAMRSYVKESLEKGHIRPSSSPLGAGFFFVAKKDGSLRPCIDYRLLNKITVKFQYPLPLLSDLFARIKGASWFTKIDLRGAYNLVRIKQGDEWKTAFNMPEGHFEYLVMPFGLSNAPSVFQSFMHDIFRNYLDKFMVVYLDDILIFSDDWESHVKQVEVDASEIGAGAVLSQRNSDGSLMKPKFSPAERNYDVGNRELAMKWAFEEWRHWLEGAKHRVVVLTDHKNLIYLESAKRLNPRQARWSLFFSRFDFVVSYLPRSKNVKADALSRSFLPDSPGVLEPVGILKEGVILSAISPDLRRVLQEFQADKPGRCPMGKLFVPDRWTSKVSSPKFKPRFIGPYKISEIINPVSFRLALPASFAIHNVFHRSLLRRYVVPVVPSVDPPAPVLVEGELEYEVEKILDSRFSRYVMARTHPYDGKARSSSRTLETALSTRCPLCLRRKLKVDSQPIIKCPAEFERAVDNLKFR
ncbi:unnamed protein product [Ranitomeya imitator]|uniref:ribonuclease H n=1 Tax=Ranitomeya imitator TaxID=111125 RepID=A0ABN9LMC3_9NEOB|nr:unnamed protein product [Ranitomeya imitator]